MKENLISTDKKVTIVSGKSRLLLIQSQRLLDSFTQLAVAIKATSEPKASSIKTNLKTGTESPA